MHALLIRLSKLQILFWPHAQLPTVVSALLVEIRPTFFIALQTVDAIVKRELD